METEKDYYSIKEYTLVKSVRLKLGGAGRYRKPTFCSCCTSNYKNRYYKYKKRGQ